MMKTGASRTEVRCPHCGQRLMDVIQTKEEPGSCILETKCQRCRRVLTIKVNTGGALPQSHSRGSGPY